MKSQLADRPPSPAWAERLVRFLDDGIAIPGTGYRIGFDGLLGLFVPMAGDALTALGALSLFALALKRRVPRSVLARMALNIALDALVGAVPMVGDLFDFAWKANRRNLTLIERAQTYEQKRNLGDYMAIGLFGLLVVSALALPLLLTVFVLSLFVK